MNFKRSTEPDEPEINFIPLIDLLLVILIFLMVTTTFSKYTQLKVELPSASKEQSSAPEEIVVEVSASGQYRLLDAAGAEPNAALSPSALSTALARKARTAKTPVVVIYADGGASHQSVIAVLDAARLAGLEKVTFAAEGETASQ